MRGARARCFASVRVRTKVRTVRGSHLVRTPTIDSTPPATAFVGGFCIFRTRIRVNALHVEYRQVETLIPYARNPRTHNDAQIAKIAASIAEFGWTTPILIDADHGIIAGHGRLAAARKLGLADVPVIELTHLSPAQKRAYVIADNRLALDAGWDEELLALELADLTEAGFDLALTGFDDAELQSLLTDAAAGDPEATDETPEDDDAADEVPDAPVIAVSRPGDVWLLGPHRLICGDASDRDVIAALMQDDRA